MTPAAGRGRRLFVRVAWIAAAALLAVLLLRTFVVGVYRVDSGSMEPFVHGSSDDGELVLVLYRRRPRLARFEPIVILRPGEHDPVVKRVGGLPGESVQVSGGDLFVGGQRVAPDVPRPALVPLYDSRAQPLSEAFQLAAGAWSEAAGTWRLDGRGAELGAAVVRAVWPRWLLDDRLDAGGVLVKGMHHVGDVALELELEPEAGEGRIAMRLTEEGDRFDLELDLDGRGAALARCVRRVGAAPPEVLAEQPLELAPAVRHRLRFANVDNALSLDLDGQRGALRVVYERNTPLGDVPDESYQHLRPRVSFGAAGLVVRVHRVRLLRDLHYTDRGEFGVRVPLQLGPDQLYVLGDNSAESLDSRDYGPVALESVIGLPLAVVWPPSAWRRLAGPEAR